VPFHFGVLHAAQFLHNLTYARQRRLNALGLDILAFSGLGSLGLSLLKSAQYLRGRIPVRRDLVVERFDEWDSWADEIWEKARLHYSLIAERSSAVLRAAYPAMHEHFIKIRVKKIGGDCIGWAVCSASRAKNHSYFGNMRLGALIDMLAMPSDAYAVISSALATVAEAKADVVVVNHANGEWNKALRQAGLLSWKTNYFLFLSPRLKEKYEPVTDYADDFYFTRGDGDGPINLW